MLECMAEKDELGAAGETLAAEHLQTRGYHILDRNWRCAHGELDIVVTDGEAIIAVEVKSRRSRKYGHPLEAITRVKLQRLRTLLGEWMRAHEAHGRMRVDGIAVDWPRGAAPTLEHRKGIA